MKKVHNTVLAAVLTALTIIIPMVFTFPPLRIVVGPYSATLASHVPVIMAMFINPFVAMFVALCSAIGFMITATPVIAVRAASHVFFAAAGAYMIKNGKNIWAVLGVTALVHAVFEVFVVYIFYLMGMVSTNKYALSFFFIITFVCTLAHHCVDFAIATAVMKPLRAAKLM